MPSPPRWIHRMQHSIRVRLLVSLLGAVVLAFAVLGALTYRNTLREAETLFDYQLEQMALSLRDQGAITPDDARALNNPRFDFVVQIWSADGQLIYASRPDSGLPPHAVLGLANVRAVAQGTTWRVYSTLSHNGLSDRIIQVAQPLRIRSTLAASAALRSMLPLLVLCPMLAVLVWWTISAALRPMQRVAREMRQRDAASLQPVDVTPLPDEIEPLVQSLNGLLERLRQAFEAQRGFVAHAAHELRSPLTALQLQAQLIERATSNPEARAAAVAELRQGIERSTRLVEQLLTLARHEPGTPAPPQTPQDLSEIVRQAVADTVAIATAKNITLELDATSNTRVAGDAHALRILARNLVDNAVRYTPNGGHVRVWVESLNGHAQLTVDDSGPGIAPSERERVFERFYRSPSTTAEGSGLGLAIVRNVAQQHGATIRLDSSPMGGLRAVVAWG